MLILGIETSCDETAVAVVEKEDSGRLILRSNVISSSLTLHATTGGIIPEQAAREQIKYILPVIQEALEKADIKLQNIDILAVTYGPGLIGSLLVGVETAKTLAYVLNKPIIPVNHMVGHVYANWFSEKIEFTALALVVSGGHTDLLLLTDHGKIKLLGGTRDDAAGECFDKCARLLGYQYPGGPKIAELAEKGDPKAFSFPRPMLGTHDYEFSFSGLKTAFLNMTKKYFPLERIGWQQIIFENKLSLAEKQRVYDLCASLEEAIIAVLVKKTLKAAKQYQVQSILLSGGVAANVKLREQLKGETRRLLPDAQLFAPAKNLCTDNAAMIAAAAAYNVNPVPWQEVTADPELYFS